MSGATNAEKEKIGVVMHYQFIICHGQYKLLYIACSASGRTPNCDNQNFIKEVHPSMKTVQKTERNITLYE